MKKAYLMLLLLCCASCALGQQVEYAVHLNSGLATFRGESAVESSSMMSYTSDRASSFTHSPYGNRFTLSYGMAGQVQRISKQGILLGVLLGAEKLRSRVNINAVYIASIPYDSFADYQLASGKAIVSSYALNLQPYIGFRRNAGALEYDFTFGTDLGYTLKRMEQGTATAADGSLHSTVRELETDGTRLDLRPRLGFVAYYKQLGISASYAHGLINYFKGYDGVNPYAYTRVARLGVVYRM